MAYLTVFRDTLSAVIFRYELAVQGEQGTRAGLEAEIYDRGHVEEHSKRSGVADPTQCQCMNAVVEVTFPGCLDDCINSNFEYGSEVDGGQEHYASMYVYTIQQ